MYAIINESLNGDALRSGIPWSERLVSKSCQNPAERYQELPGLARRPAALNERTKRPQPKRPRQACDGRRFPGRAWLIACLAVGVAVAGFC